MVIACDSAGGIGPKTGDQIKVSGEIIGKFTTRVALMEVLAVGAKPISIINTLSVEYNPTGKEIIKGIKGELAQVGLDETILINGSTEENIQTGQTGLGVTVIGIADQDKLLLASSQNNDLLLAIGLPLVGEEVLAKGDLCADLADIKKLLAIEGVHEIIPVGSKGIAYEADLLARMSGLICRYQKDLALALDKSAGPSTTILTSVSRAGLEQIEWEIKKPLTVIAVLKS